MNTNLKRPYWQKNSFVYLLVLAIAFVSVPLSGQSIYDSRTMLLSARGTALARSLVSEVSDVSCMAANPAALSFVKDSGVVVNFYHELTNQMLATNIVMPLRFGDQHTLGLGIMRYTYRHYQYGVDIAYSYKISSSFSAGLLCQPRYGTTSESKLYSTTVGVGIFYFPVPGTRYGLSLLGIGNGLDLIPEQNRFIHTKQTKLVMGTSMNYPTWLKRPIMNLSVSIESYLDKNYFRYSTGLELMPFEMISVRLGYLAGPSKDVQHDHGVSYGLGMRMGIWVLDYGIGESSFGKFHQISVRAHIARIL